MTECERIIQQGILDEKFFEEEKRCDFLVTTHRKKIWAVEIDLLLEFDRVCKKHDLNIFLKQALCSAQFVTAALFLGTTILTL